MQSNRLYRSGAKNPSLKIEKGAISAMFYILSFGPYNTAHAVKFCSTIPTFRRDIVITPLRACGKEPLSKNS